MERAPDLRHAQRRADAGASARERRGEKPSDDDDEDVIDQSRARGVIGQAFETDLGRVEAKPGTFGRDRSSSGRAKKSRKRSRRPPIDQFPQFNLLQRWRHNLPCSSQHMLLEILEILSGRGRIAGCFAALAMFLLAVVTTGGAYLVCTALRVQRWGFARAEPPLPASSLTRNKYSKYSLRGPSCNQA